MTAQEGPKRTPASASTDQHTRFHRSRLCRVSEIHDGLQNDPWPQNGPRNPRRDPKRPKEGPTATIRTVHKARKKAQQNPKREAARKSRPVSLRSGPKHKRATKRPKMPPRGPRKLPKGLQEAPKSQAQEVSPRVPTTTALHVVRTCTPRSERNLCGIQGGKLCKEL